MFLSTRRRHFDDRNDFLALSTVFYDIIGDETLSETYFVVDALDNCSSDQERPGLDHFLHLIARSMTLSNKIRWLVSGNHSDPVKSVLEEVGYLHVKLGPGLQGSRKAVDSYCWYAEGVLSHWVVAIATRSLGPIARYIKY
jgi:hypothetical protein